MNVYAYVDKTRANADKTYPVYVIVKNQRGRFFVNTGITTKDRLLDGRVFPKSDRQCTAKTTLLAKYLTEIEAVCLRHELSSSDNKELKAVIQQEVFGVSGSRKKKMLSDYVAEFAATKRKSTSVLYGITARKVARYGDVRIDDADADWLESFRLWCISSGMKTNGAGKELRNIRAVYNWAKRRRYTSNYPFDGYSIVEEETVPNDLSVEQIRMLRDYPCEQWQQKYIDFFMLSFYLAGINPGDLLMLRRTDMKDGHISFVRRKTDKQGAKKIRSIILPVVEEARKIISRYPSKEGYLIGFMDGRSDYHSFVKRCNETLKKIGTCERVEDKVGKLRKIEYHPVFPDITLYSARYSFGTIAANDLDISEQTIAQCFGHSWSRHVTARYISSDQRKIDNAVRKVVRYVAGNKSLP